MPASAFLTLKGSGALKVLNNRNYSVGIGSNYNDPYGTIDYSHRAAHRANHAIYQAYAAGAGD